MFRKYNQPALVRRTGEIEMGDNATTGTSTGSTGTDNGGLPAIGKQIGANAGTAAGKATNLAHTAQDYADKVSEAAGQAKVYVSDRAAVVGEKIKEFSNKDFSELTDDAKQFARQKPGQAILISAAVGLVLGLLLRGRR
jgi:ElaB/YqjD/DUF883 family membrane-anchored ribosome-binding protein